MYAVIFKAEINALDQAYGEMAERMRELAINEYGCLDFTSCTDGNLEIAISYWETTEQIRAWKNNVEHQQAQALGKGAWYKAYQVELVEVVRRYASSA